MSIKFHKALLLSMALMCAVSAIAIESEKRKADRALAAAFFLSGTMAVVHGQIGLLNRDIWTLAYAVVEGTVATICWFRI